MPTNLPRLEQTIYHRTRWIQGSSLWSTDARDRRELEAETDPISLIEEKHLSKCDNIKAAQEKLRYTANKMIENNSNKQKKPIDHININDLVYVKRNFLKTGESKKLSSLYYDLSFVIDKKYPVFLIESLQSKNQRWLHFCQLKKRPEINPLMVK